MTYLNADPSAKGNLGKILARNTSRAPWQNQMDFRYAVTVPTGGRTRAEVTLDIFNFLNLLNKDWGWQDLGGLPRFGQDDRLRRPRRRDRQDALQPEHDHGPDVPGHVRARRSQVALGGAVGRAVQVLTPADSFRNKKGRSTPASDRPFVLSLES